jgi:hypothetical protein
VIGQLLLHNECSLSIRILLKDVRALKVVTIVNMETYTIPKVTMVRRF